MEVKGTSFGGVDEKGMFLAASDVIFGMLLSSEGMLLSGISLPGFVLFSGRGGTIYWSGTPSFSGLAESATTSGGGTDTSAAGAGAGGASLAVVGVSAVYAAT